MKVKVAISAHSSLQKAMNIGGSSSSLIHDEGKTRLTKSFFKDVLSTHYKQPDLKVKKSCDVMRQTFTLVCRF